MEKKQPKEAVVEWLCNPVQVPNKPSQIRERSADRDTILFLKEHQVSDFYACVVQYNTILRETRQETCLLYQSSPGFWSVLRSGGKFTDVHKTLLEHEQLLTFFELSTPPFLAAGEVMTDTNDISRVRLLCESGLTLEDTVNHHLVLFLSSDICNFPLTIELYNDQDQLAHSLIMKSPKQ